MADDKTDEKKQSSEARYTPEQMIAESRGILGVATHVAAGALHGDDRKSLTVSQGKSAVKSFLGRKGTGE